MPEIKTGVLTIPIEMIEFFNAQNKKEVLIPYSEKTRSWPPLLTENLISKNGKEVSYSLIEYSKIARLRIEQKVITEFIFLYVPEESIRYYVPLNWIED